MRTVLLLFILFLFVQVQSQVPKAQTYSPFDFRSDTARSRYVAFVGDTTEATVDSHYNKAVDSAYGMNKDYDFEFRLWKRTMTVNFNDVFILTLHNNKWVARYFDLKDSDRNGIKLTERPVDQSKVDQLWELLVQNSVLTLPDQSALRERMGTYVVDTANLQYENVRRVEIMDGILYSFELLTPTKKRFYTYGNPQGYLKYYGNIRELYNAVVIILLVEKFLGQPLIVS